MTELEDLEIHKDTHKMHARLPLWTHIRKPYFDEYLRKTKLSDLEIHKVTIDASVSTWTPPTP
jgi:hypothetical protein